MIAALESWKIEEETNMADKDKGTDYRARQVLFFRCFDEIHNFLIN